MKTRITQKTIKSTYNTIISVPYCALQFLLLYRKPVYYTAGTYGWNADIYDINGIAIVTGYRPFGNIKLDAEILRKYDEAAQIIGYNYNLTYDQMWSELNNLLSEFIEEVTA